MTSSKPRIHYLEFMKGLCTLKLVAYHTRPTAISMATSGICL